MRECGRGSPEVKGDVKGIFHFLPEEAAEGRTINENGWNGVEGRVRKIYFSCFFVLMV